MLVDLDSRRLDMMHKIAELGRSQGMYSRLFRYLSKSPDKNSILDYVATVYGTDYLDIIRWYECG